MSGNQSWETKKPNLYEYESYRVFMRDWLGYLRATERRFSLRKLASASGLSHGYLTNVMNDRFSLSTDALDRLSPHIKLKKSEIEFLKLLLLVEDGDSPEVRLKAIKKIGKLLRRQHNSPEQILAYEYFSNWLNVVIREMATLPDFKLEPKWIRNRLHFSVPLGDIRESMAFLMENKLIRITKNGFKVEKEPIMAQGLFFSVSLMRHFEEMLTREKESIYEVPRNRRDLNGVTIGLSGEQFDRIKKELDQALSKIVSIAKEDQPSQSVYHISLGAFPLTEDFTK